MRAGSPVLYDMMNTLSLRLYMLLCSVAMWLRGFAQVGDDDMDSRQGPRRVMDPEEMEGMMDNSPLHFTITDVLMVVLVLGACYVFGKIWKGCSYIILLFAAIFYYMLH